MTDADIRQILETTKVIAVVGFSAKPERPSHRVANFLASKGYDLRLVNPGLKGQTHLGGKVYGALSEIPDPIDMVDIFRASDAVASIVDDALRIPSVKVIWTQLGVRDDVAAARARAAGLRVVQDRCPAIEHPRLI